MGNAKAKPRPLFSQQSSFELHSKNRLHVSRRPALLRRTSADADHRPFDYLAAPYTHDCGDRLETCPSIRRLTMAMDWYQNMREHLSDKAALAKSVIEYVDHYTNLLNDYQHILAKHLNSTKQQNTENFMAIHKRFARHIQCDVDSCKQYVRVVMDSSTNRATTIDPADIPLSVNEAAPNDNNNENDANDDNDKEQQPKRSILSSKKQLISEEEEMSEKAVNFHIELLDVIHCYFMHSLDLGLRVSMDAEKDEDIVFDIDDEEENALALPSTTDEFERKQSMEPHSTTIDSDAMLTMINHDSYNPQEAEAAATHSALYDDDELKAMESVLSGKRDKFKTLRGLNLTENGKFFADLSAEPDDDHHELKRAESFTYDHSLGRRFYFWSWYKDNEAEDIQWNIGKKYKELYVERKYENLKDEVINNEIYKVALEEFERTYQKAMHYYQMSEVIRSIRCSTVGYGHCHYDVDNNDELHVEHIMSVMLYTDHPYLSSEFTMNCRERGAKETFEAYKARIREYAEWNRSLRETVELYGTTMQASELKTFYTGLSSQIVFNQFRLKICSPLSTSPQLSVIMLFGQNDDGIIIDLGQSAQPGNTLKYFNCSLFSCYGEEDERLFFGGFAPLQINSIRVVQNQQDYRPFLTTLCYFDTVLCGASDIKNKCNEGDYERIRHLVHQCKNNDNDNNNAAIYPLYIREMFKQFVMTKERIHLDLQSLHWHYKPFVPLIVCTKIKNNLVNFLYLASLFVKVREITVKMVMFGSISESYIKGLLEQIKQLKIVKQSHNLHMIKLELIEKNVNEHNWKQFETNMKELGCSLQLIGKGREGLNELIITLQ